MLVELEKDQDLKMLTENLRLEEEAILRQREEDLKICKKEQEREKLDQLILQDRTEQTAAKKEEIRKQEESNKEYVELLAQFISGQAIYNTKLRTQLIWTLFWFEEKRMKKILLDLL